MEEIVPTLGLKLHVTPRLLVPVTLGVNCCICEVCRLALAGLIDTATVGWRVICALADLVESAELIAVTVTLCEELMNAGAV